MRWLFRALATRRDKDRDTIHSFRLSVSDKMGAVPNDITRLLAEISQGDHEAESRLAQVVYKELHRLARRCMHGERPDHTLQPTVLVHEAFLRLVGDHRGDLTESNH